MIYPAIMCLDPTALIQCRRASFTAIALFNQNFPSCLIACSINILVLESYVITQISTVLHRKFSVELCRHKNHMIIMNQFLSQNV